MRPIFVIYLAAGITLLFAALNTAAYIGHAYYTHNAIVSLNPEGDDLERMLAVKDHHLELAAEAFVLTLLQAGIIFSARKLSKRVVPLNNFLEPVTAAKSASQLTP